MDTLPDRSVTHVGKLYCHLCTEVQQLGAKLFANAGFGLSGNEYFEFANYQVAECITAEGRRIHKQMESLAQNEPYNFKVVFGFTDSTFFNARTGIEKVQDFSLACKDKLGVTVELKWSCCCCEPSGIFADRRLERWLCILNFLNLAKINFPLESTTAANLTALLTYSAIKHIS